ncbi:MAG TPA: hypothetical protein VMM13_08135 [Euzebya sp.]|nr:hypothetical protein [Euzebya sp.]
MRHRHPLLSAVLLLLLITAGCTDGEAGATPEGFTRHEAEGFSVSTPEGWTVRADQPDRLMVVGVATVEDSVEALDVKVGPISGDFDAAILGAIDPFRFGAVDDYQTIEEREVEVAGADRGFIFDATYQDSDAAQRTRQWDVFAADEGGSQVVYLSLKAPEEVFDEAQMSAILSSLEVSL